MSQVHDDEDEHGGQVGGEGHAQEPPAKSDLHLDRPGSVGQVEGVEARLLDVVDGEVLWAQVVQYS